MSYGWPGEDRVQVNPNAASTPGGGDQTITPLFLLTSTPKRPINTDSGGFAAPCCSQRTHALGLFAGAEEEDPALGFPRALQKVRLGPGCLHYPQSPPF